MRDLLLSLLIPLALIYGCFSATGATLVLMWVGFGRPYDFSWGLWRDLPVWQIAFAIAFLSNLARGQLKVKAPATLVIFMALMAWIILSCVFSINPENSWLFFSIYLVPLIFGPMLTFAIINDLRTLKLAVWVAAGSLALTAAKTGLSLTLGGGGALTEQSSGFVGDNNVFGLVLCLVVGILMGLRRTLPQGDRIRAAFYLGLAFVVLTIIYTKSRGALLTLGGILMMASLLGDKPVKHLLVLFVVAALAYVVLPDENFDRLQTLQNVSADQSAMGRVENWGLAWEAAVDHPLLGIGLGNHVPYHAARETGVAIRVAHSIYFQILGEVGFVGLALYLLFVIVTLTTLLAARKELAVLAARYPELEWTKDLAFWMLCCYVGYLFGSALLNMLFIEFPWYVAFFGVMLRNLAHQAAAQAGAASTRVPAPRAG